MATMAELEAALVNADKAGDADAARKLAAFIVTARKNQSAADRIPGVNGAQPQIPGTTPQSPEPTLAEKAVGTGEAALTAITGATSGTLGAIGGLGAGIAGAISNGSQRGPNGEDLVDEAMASGAQALTYQPRTRSGQEQAAAVGDFMQNALPALAVAHTLPPVVQVAREAGPAGVLARAGAEGTARDVAGLVSPAAGEAAAGAVSKTIDTASRVADLAQKGVTTLPRRALEAVRGKSDQAGPTAGTLGSAGAAATDAATQRVATAEQLGFTGDKALTLGQATRDPSQLKFEVESAKLPEEGSKIRERLLAQNEQHLQNFDTAVDQTGAQAPEVGSLRAVGASVDKALVEQFKADKAKVRAAYKAADQAGELTAPVQLDALIDHLNQAAPEAPTAPLINTARNLAIKLGIAEDQGGVLVPAKSKPKPFSSLMNSAPETGITLKRAEIFRQAINRNTDYEPTNVRQATIIKGLIDEATAGKGGQLYRNARALRTRLAQNYEDRGVIAKLLNNKRGTGDRQVAIEDVFDHTIRSGSLDDVRNVRRVLHRSGTDGQQAWRELQGQTIRWIKDQATKKVATDASGARVISPAALDKAIQALDHDGKLDFIFGKLGAQRMRDINDLAKYTRTVPPEAAINTSNTAATLLAAFGDVGASVFTGIPAPVATAARLGLKHIKDVKLRKRIDQALTAAQTAVPERTK